MAFRVKMILVGKVVETTNKRLNQKGHTKARLLARRYVSIRVNSRLKVLQ